MIFLQVTIHDECALVIVKVIVVIKVCQIMNEGYSLKESVLDRNIYPTVPFVPISMGSTIGRQDS
jgi:hypothetical protein